MKSAFRVACLWAVLVFAYMLWESKYTAGPIGWLLDFQYDRFGYYKPAVTFLLLALLLGVPIALLYLRRLRRKPRDRTAIDDTQAAIDSARRQLRLLIAVSVTAATCSLVSLLVMVTLPRPGGEPVAVPTDQRLGAELPRGSVYVENPRATGPAVRYNQRLLWLDHVVRYVPVATAKDDSRASLFLELADEGRADRFSLKSRYEGVMVRGAMPPSVSSLYADLGLLAPGPHYVLFTTPGDLARPWILAVLQFAFGGLIVLGFAMLQARRLARLKRDANAVASTEQQPEVKTLAHV